MRRPAFQYLISPAVLVTCTLLALPFRSKLALTDFAMLYLLGIVVVSMNSARHIALIHSLLSVAAFHLQADSRMGRGFYSKGYPGLFSVGFLLYSSDFPFGMLSHVQSDSANMRASSTIWPT